MCNEGVRCIGERAPGELHWWLRAYNGHCDSGGRRRPCGGQGAAKDKDKGKDKAKDEPKEKSKDKGKRKDKDKDKDKAQTTFGSRSS